MTTNHVNEIVGNVSQALDSAQDDSAQVTALERLQDEIKADMQGMTAEQVKDYMPQLTKQLEENNQLPVLALAFADQLGGDLNDSDLRSELRSANRAVRDGDNSRELDKVLLNFLVDNYDEGLDLSETNNDSWLRDDSNISKADISAKLAEFREARDSEKQNQTNQDAAGDIAETMLTGGDKSLFHFIDRNSKDSFVTKAELQKYLSDAESSGSSDGQFAPEKQQAVQGLVDNWDDKDTGNWLRGGYRGDDSYLSSGLRADELAKAAGSASSAEFIAALTGENAATQQSSDGESTEEVAVANAEAESVEGDSSEESVSSNQDETDTPVEQVSDAQQASDEQQVSEEQQVAQDGQQEPIDYEVGRGDSYWRIAETILGDNATPRQIFDKMNELQEYNNNQPLMWYPGNPQRIKIPPVKTEASRAIAAARPTVISV